MDLSLNIANFDKMCRICIQLSETLIPVLLHDIINMLKECASIDISEDDELPNQICDTCLNRLQDSYNFQNLCKKSDYDLRRVIAEHKKNKQNKNVEEERDDKTFLLKDEVLNLDNDLKDYNLETLSIKSEDLPADDEIENNYNDETFSLKNEETHTDDEKTNESIVENIEEDKTKHKTKKSKTGTKRKKRFICEKCDRKFDTPQYLGWHCKGTHKAKGTKCSYCNVICYHPLHLKVHEESHTNSTIKCEHCGKMFASNAFLNSHMYTHKTDRPFKCEQCNSAFKTKYVLNGHIKAKHTVEKKPAKLATCHICGKTVKFRNIKIHHRVHAERNPLDCPKCEKKFLTKDTLKNHIKLIHENINTVRHILCNVCGLKIKSAADLQRHMLTHTGEKPFQCDKCENRYRTSDALKTHVRNVHLNIREHVCSVCSQAFYDKKVLANHMRRHTGERPFACFICGKTFAAKAAVYIHLRQVHKVEKKPTEHNMSSE